MGVGSNPTSDTLFFLHTYSYFISNDTIDIIKEQKRRRNKMSYTEIYTHGKFSKLWRFDGEKNLVSEVGFEPTPTEVDCDLNAAP